MAVDTMLDDTRKFELASRAMACKGWRWMPGMLTVEGRRIYSTDAERDLLDAIDQITGDRIVGREWVPDLDDPATLGCFEHGILAVIYGPRFHVHHAPGDSHRPWASWRWDPTEDDYEEVAWRGATKAGALVAALECAHVA